jgi:hypothetical protein
MIARFFAQTGAVARIDQYVPPIASPVEKLDLQARAELMIKVAVLIGSAIPIQVKPSLKIKILFGLI